MKLHYFKLKELCSKDILANYPHIICPYTAILLDETRYAIGMPILVNYNNIDKAGVRSLDDNFQVKKAKQSMHITGRAFDIKIKGLNGKEILALLEKTKQYRFWKGVGVYSWGLHLDTRSGSQIVWYG